MARTIRARNWAREHGSFRGSKTALSWTHAEFHSGGDSAHIWWHTYREMTVEERKYEYVRRHTDKWDMSYRRQTSCVDKQGRHDEQQIYRAQCKRAIDDYMKDIAEDVVINAGPAKSAKQYWW